MSAFQLQVRAMEKERQWRFGKAGEQGAGEQRAGGGGAGEKCHHSSRI